MMGRAIALASKCLTIGMWIAAGCVATNPAWDGPVSTSEGSSTEAETGGDASSTASGETIADGSGASSSEGTSVVSVSSSGSSSGDSGPEPVVCDAVASPVGACPESCAGCPDQLCPIDCGDAPPCRAMEVTCPEGWPCRVACTGKDVCKDATIICPAGHACEVLCSGEHSCEKTTVQCGGGPCTVECTGHPQACKDLDVVCGASDSAIDCDMPQDMPAPKVESGADSSCACTMNGC